jgi:hypothetical protein
MEISDNVTDRHNQPADHLFSIKFYPASLENVLGIIRLC